MSTKTKNEKRITLRTPSNLHERLVNVCEEKGMSINMQVIEMLWDGVRKEEEKINGKNNEDTD